MLMQMETVKLPEAATAVAAALAHGSSLCVRLLWVSHPHNLDSRHFCQRPPCTHHSQGIADADYSLRYHHASNCAGRVAAAAAAAAAAAPLFSHP